MQKEVERKRERGRWGDFKLIQRIGRVHVNAFPGGLLKLFMMEVAREVHSFESCCFANILPASRLGLKAV